MSESSFEKKPEIILTGDGSHSLYSPQFDQHYHNPGGAIAESLHVFFRQNGLFESLEQKPRKLSVLEVGFGTGLNLLLLMDHLSGLPHRPSISYQTVEAWPISSGVAQQFNYDEFLAHPELKKHLVDLFKTLKPGANRFTPIPGLAVTVFVGLFDDFSPQEPADFILHDPFSPDKNEELWTGEVFKKLKSWSNREAVLSTYCAASKARGAMAWAGWHVAEAEGALGKREMTLAALDIQKLDRFKQVNEKRLAERYEAGDF